MTSQSQLGGARYNVNSFGLGILVVLRCLWCHWCGASGVILGA